MSVDKIAKNDKNLNRQVKGDLCKVNLQRVHEYSKVTEGKSEVVVWHKPFSELHFRDMLKLIKRVMTRWLNLCKIADYACVTCAKMISKLFKSYNEIYTRAPSELVHSDLWRPTRCSSLADSFYFITMIDDHARCCTIYFLK